MEGGPLKITQNLGCGMKLSLLVVECLGDILTAGRHFCTSNGTLLFKVSQDMGPGHSQPTETELTGVMLQLLGHQILIVLLPKDQSGSWEDAPH